MNTSQSRRLLKLPMLLWRRFHIWRAQRMYRAIPPMKAKADALMRKHAQAPCPLFDRLDDENENYWKGR
jgi:hypothetical protein